MFAWENYCLSSLLLTQLWLSRQLLSPCARGASLLVSPGGTSVHVSAPATFSAAIGLSVSPTHPPVQNPPITHLSGSICRVFYEIPFMHLTGRIDTTDSLLYPWALFNLWRKVNGENENITSDTNLPSICVTAHLPVTTNTFLTTYSSCVFENANKLQMLMLYNFEVRILGIYYSDQPSRWDSGSRFIYSDRVTNTSLSCWI